MYAKIRKWLSNFEKNLPTSKKRQLYEKVMNFSQEMKKTRKILLCNSHTSTLMSVCACVFVCVLEKCKIVGIKMSTEKSCRFME